MRAVALNPKPHNLLDHLGVLAAILEIPLIVCDETTHELATSLYPQVATTLMNERELTLSYLAANFDVLFVSSKLWAVELFHTFPLLCQKKMRIVYCPHGNSDKGHTFTAELHNPEDVALVYGEHMVDLLKDTGMFDKIGHVVPTGNYRYEFFLKHRAHLEKAAREKLGKLDPANTTLLYAPTWPGEENPSSFYEECAALIEQMPSSFNLVVKLHPYLQEKDPARTAWIHETYKDHPGVVFLDEFPPVYPLLSLSDAYLGDFSSIGYDFLAFDKPMYFFDSGDSVAERGRFLHRCGMLVATRRGNVFDFIAQTLEQNRSELATIRQATYRYAFGDAQRSSTLRDAIFKAL